jgi:hypothetical protein
MQRTREAPRPRGTIRRVISSETLHTQGTTATKKRIAKKETERSEKDPAGDGRRFASAERRWITHRPVPVASGSKPSSRQPPHHSSQQKGRHRAAGPGPGAAAADDRDGARGGDGRPNRAAASARTPPTRPRASHEYCRVHRPERRAGPGPASEPGGD